MSEEKKLPPRHIQLGLEYGLLNEGFNLKDYVQSAAVTKDGYELVVVDGVQRAGKSNLSLQIASWAKAASLRIRLGREPTEREIWEAVLKDLVFKPSDFVRTLEAVPDDNPLDCLTWDDIGAHYTNTAFRINPEEYSAIDSTFTVVGTKCRVIVVNIPNLTRLAKNIKDNATFEIFVGKNKKRMMKRIFRLPGIRSMDMNLFKIDIEPPSDFDIYKIPAWAWVQYEDKRVELAKEALKVLKAVTNMEELEGFISVTDAVKLCRKHGLNWGVSTLQQNCSRGILTGQKVNGKLCIDEASLFEVLEVETLPISE